MSVARPIHSYYMYSWLCYKILPGIKLLLLLIVLLCFIFIFIFFELKTDHRPCLFIFAFFLLLRLSVGWYDIYIYTSWHLFIRVA